MIEKCSEVREDTWINKEIIGLYVDLHHTGYAHSVEAWAGDKLVGGVYGISIGGAFFGGPVAEFYDANYPDQELLEIEKEVGL